MNHEVFNIMNLAYIFMMMLGGLIHLFGTLMEQSGIAGHKINIKEYRDSHPYKLTLGLFTSIACLVLFYSMEQLNIVSAFLAGYAGDSIVKKIANTTQWGVRQ